MPVVYRSVQKKCTFYLNKMVNEMQWLTKLTFCINLPTYAMKMTTASKDLLEMHFADLSSKPFFPKLVEFMLSGPVVAMVWEGKGAVKTDRKMLGETNPADSLPGTIRGDYCIDIGRNICHGSDSVETAKKEIALWFKGGELNNYCCANNSWVYE